MDTPDDNNDCGSSPKDGLFLRRNWGYTAYSGPTSAHLIPRKLITGLTPKGPDSKN